MWGLFRDQVNEYVRIKYYRGGIEILEIPRWGMAQNQLGTTVLVNW